MDSPSHSATRHYGFSLIESPMPLGENRLGDHAGGLYGPSMNVARPTHRRGFLRTSVAAGLAAGFARLHAGNETGPATMLPFENGRRPLVRFPEKRPLILLTRRPPQLETPFEIFHHGILTPNDAFFVRYHLANIPLTIDASTFRLTIGGAVNSALKLSLDDLQKQFEQVEVVAVAQCSGNSRGFFEPRVAGGQLGHGAMGNARWRGVRLRDVLEKAGLPPDARQVAFDGLDTAVVQGTPDFTKSLDLEQIMAGEVILAHTMNGEPLPMLNGFPLRLVVPGYYATYWVKHLHEITVLKEPFSGYWVKSAYRIPANEGACVEPGTTPKSTVAINRMNVRSFITSHADGAVLPHGQETLVRGIAFDGGEGIGDVMFSPDGGKTWLQTQLGENLGRFSFREWKIAWKPAARGAAILQSRAINRIGQTQPTEPLWNPAGYMRNVVESVGVAIA